MGDGLLSLSWNNHRSTFYHVISNLKRKERYSDATLACNGEFYPVHKLVLSVCSDYFDSMLDKTPCKHPVIVLRDVRQEDLESILNYMYLGSVSVPQSDLANLIKTAELLGIKGLAVPDDHDICKLDTEAANCESAQSSKGRVSPSPKRRRIQERQRERRRSSSSNADIEEIASPLLKVEVVDEELNEVETNYDDVVFPGLSSDVKLESRLNESRYEDPLQTYNENLESNAESTSQSEPWLTADDLSTNDFALPDNCDPNLSDACLQQPDHDGSRPLMVASYSLRAGHPKSKKKYGLARRNLKFCRLCEYSSDSRRNVVRHENAIHFAKSIICPYCDFSTNRQSVFDVHERRHTGETPFQCDQCIFATISEKALKMHIFKKHVQQR